MKEWFKYDIGYVNIDDGNFYLSNSGNWTDCQKLPEKSASANRKNLGRQIGVLSFFIIMAMIAISAFLYNEIHDYRAYLILLAAPILVYFIYRYLKRKIGAAFKIPRENIASLQLNIDELTIEFKNGNGKPDQHKIKKVSKNGILIIEQLSNEP